MPKTKKVTRPLYFAINHDYKIAELLIEKGLIALLKQRSGKTLLQLAQERKQIESTVPDMIFDGEPNSYVWVSNCLWRYRWRWI